jgi:hypothetical protein
MNKDPVWARKLPSDNSSTKHLTGLELRIDGRDVCGRAASRILMIGFEFEFRNPDP